jgi:hypothetical protein
VERFGHRSRTPWLEKLLSRGQDSGFLQCPIPYPKPHLHVFLLNSVFIPNFFKTLFIFYFLPSKQFSSQTILIPGINSFKQNIAKQRKSRNPLTNPMGMDAVHRGKAEPQAQTPGSAGGYHQA